MDRKINFTNCSKRTKTNKRSFFLFDKSTFDALNFKKLTALVFILICLTTVSPGCASKKKAAAEKAKKEQEAKLAQEQAAQKQKAEEEARKRKEEEDRKKAQKTPSANLENYFQQISTASNIDAANAKINEALKMFTSSDIPVLIIIDKSGTIIDYDKPTTALKYLQYIKDQKNNPNAIDHVDMESSGKIKKIVLIKK